ncbi:MAG: hypothetical protein SGARI_000468 [Bacillariaceae sp.]
MVLSAKEMLLEDTNPQIILGVITDPSVDNTTEDVESDCRTGPNVTYDDYELRQYGLIDVQGRHAGYEDATLKEYYFDKCFSEDKFANISYTQENMGGTVETTTTTTFAYTAQGNIIALPTVPGIIDGFENGYLDDNASNNATATAGGAEVACENDLMDRLFHAISAPFLLLEEAFAAEDLDLVAGDVRCLGANQAAAAGIFLHVEDKVTGEVVVHIDVRGSFDDTSVNPYPEFVAQYDAWRAENPCGSFNNGMEPPGTGPTPSPTTSGVEMGRRRCSAGIVSTITIIILTAVLV